MADYTIDKIKYDSNRYILKDSNAPHLTTEGNLKIPGTFGADVGIFNTLIATNATIETLDVDDLTADNATVVGLLDVQGELHTNNWTNANISNIGGSFYISPTVSTSIASTNTPMSITITGSAGNRTFSVSGGNFVTDSVKIYSNGTTTPVYATGTTPGWPVGSHVMITGSIRVKTAQVNGMDYPLGTCSGYLTAALSSSGFTVGSIDSPALETIIGELGTSNLKSYDIKISMFEIGPQISIKPVGIIMTSYGVDKSTYIDIYGGVNSKGGACYFPTADTEIDSNKTYYIYNGSSYSEVNIPDVENIKNYYEYDSQLIGYTEPNTRIGYLGGIPQYKDTAGNIYKPTGWGIYTDNGYFKGTVVADSGEIGNLSISNGGLESGTKDTIGYVYLSANNLPDTIGIDNYEKSDWKQIIGTNFAVDSNGSIYANNGKFEATSLRIEFNSINNSGQKETITDYVSLNGEDYKGILNLLYGGLEVDCVDSTGKNLIIDKDILIERFSNIDGNSYNKGDIIRINVNEDFIIPSFTYSTTNQKWLYTGNTNFNFINNNGIVIEIRKDLDDFDTLEDFGIEVELESGSSLENQEEIIITFTNSEGAIKNLQKSFSTSIETLTDNTNNSIKTLTENINDSIETLQTNIRKNSDRISIYENQIKIDATIPSITLSTTNITNETANYYALQLTSTDLSLIKKENNKISGIKIDAEQVSIFDDTGKENTWFKQEKMYSPNIYFHQLIPRFFTTSSVNGNKEYYGSIGWIARENNHLSLKLIGDTDDN